MNSNETIYQSRRGYHPCSHDLYLKLKSLYKWYWQTIYDFHRWHRWWRKDPSHRPVLEPACCPIFLKEAVWHKPVRKHGVDGFKRYPKTVIDLEIPNLYHQSRIPQPAPVPVFDIDTQTKISRLYETLRSFFEGTTHNS